jgi:hypothetical protein
MEAITKQIAKLSTEDDIAAVRKILTGQLKKIKEEPAANGGAGKAEVEKPAAKAAAKSSAKVETTKKVAKLAAGEAEPVKEAKKTDGVRVTRIAGKQAEALKKGLKLSDEQKKEFESGKKSFREYVDSLTDEDWDSKNIDEHISDFVNLKKGAAVVPAVIEVISLSIDGLKEIESELTATVDPLVFWHAKTGRNVTGPIAVSEEECSVTEMDGEEYLVGDESSRVYKGEAEAECLGFAGFGKFKNIVV